jgi:ribosomal protein L7Ae-like RNA K-turn-binding protein
MEIFKENIGFNSDKKNKNLNHIIKNKSNTSYVRQIIVPGTEIRRLIEEEGYNLQLFPKVTNFFRNERKMSKQTFRNSILNCIKDKKLYKELKKIYNYNILPVQISKIEIINKPTEMIDISVKNENFIANGLIVHNSAARFSRLREGAAKEFYKRIAEACNKEFLGKENLKGIIIGGPGHSKEEFIEYLNQQLKDKVIGIKDITYTDEQGLYDLVDKSQDTLVKEVIAEEKAIMQRFFTLLAKEPNRVSYGLEEVKKALSYSAVEVLLLSEDLDEKLIDEFEQKAEATKAEVQLISLETREGAQLKDLGGVAAILRYAIQ